MNQDPRPERVPTRPEPALPGTAPLANSDDYCGVRLKGRYVIERELARGGIGIVYLARDEQLLSKRVVIKVLLRGGDRREWITRKFRHEIAALARIDHPGVVGALDAGSMPDGRPFFVMQFVEGVTLRSILESERLSLGRVGRIVRQIAQGLGAAHEKGVFHRDLKPDNVMVQTLGDGEEHVKLIDFGIATVKDLEHSDAATAGTAIAGTMHYMAPEQLEGNPTASSDIYALGIIAYEMVTGRRPFNPSSPYQLLWLQRRGVGVKPSALRPDLPPAAEAILMRALAFAPENRYQRARDFGEDLSRALAAATGTRGVRIDTAGPIIPDPRPGTAPTQPDPDGRDTAPFRTPSAVRQPIGLGAVQRGLFIIAVAALLLATGALGAWLGIRQAGLGSGRVEPDPVQNVPVDPAPLPERTLDYSITVQKYRNGRPYQDPFRLAGEINFERDYRVRLTFSSPQEGYLYIVNEGPPAADGSAAYVLLFPSPTANGGSPVVAANRLVQIPGRSWFEFDGMAGTEKLWLIWSARSVAELEAVRGVANSSDKGLITDPGDLGAVREFLATRAAPRPEVSRDDEAKRTAVRGTGNVLVYLIRLEHH